MLLSTHILPEVDAVCDRVLIIDRGRIVAEGTPQDLRRGWPDARSVAPRSGAACRPRSRSGLPGVVAVEETGTTARRACVSSAREGADLSEEIFHMRRSRADGSLRELTRESLLARGRLRA